jgi:hypothetical protein
MCDGGDSGDWFASKMDEIMNSGVAVSVCRGFVSEMDGH